MSVPRSALKKWGKVREFALGLPVKLRDEATHAYLAGRGIRRIRPGKADWVRVPLDAR
ncbi:hypothetical protein [Streptomyces sp. NRRL S-646]|uniref:hypothetical protein n=1 Tax=Streptomyces sp. NRRL S-646 TaxID=1463917 RepID=UPI000AEA86F3|nr:hypothetical protein [Streptomyces sp. NRRL S-646]